MSAKDRIIHENGKFWVCRVGKGHYEVLENVGCGSTRRGTFHFSNRPEYALGRAISDCVRRAEA
ncbi:hypothetical protein [Sphingopyxis sp. JAI128]|uniref:hypothetical protein n=1 Tax=Sphingopyxis sp. JAI128 TaxID=2723066 RepID=UPI001617576A|nr:hypothetical protein [Sphingopyxis sp. JAI128]MBB6424974.1 hypothetical protein [Sphingopyxis sp. JAI128]